MKVADKDADNFLRGFAAAIGWLVRDRDETTLAVHAMNDNGVTLDHLRAAKVDDFDLQPITKAWKDK